MDISAVHVALLPEIRERLVLVADGTPIAEIGEVLEELASYFEALGLCHLLEAADVDEFTENLVRSAHARRFFLERSKSDENLDDRHLALSRGSTLLDAMASGDLTLAREIASLSIRDWHPAWEYEDDFCFFHFLNQSLVDATQPLGTAHAATLITFERALEGGKSPRLDVCKALIARNSLAFKDALIDRLNEIEAELDEEREFTYVLEGDLCYWPRSFVSVEGLALLRLGEAVGLPPIKGELPLCPSLARVPVTSRARRDFFRELTE